VESELLDAIVPEALVGRLSVGIAGEVLEFVKVRGGFDFDSQLSKEETHGYCAAGQWFTKNSGPGLEDAGILELRAEAAIAQIASQGVAECGWTTAPFSNALAVRVAQAQVSIVMGITM